MIIVSEDEDIPHLAYLVIHRIVEVVGSLLPGTALHKPAPVLDDGAVGCLPAVQVHGRAVYARNVERTSQLVDMDGSGCLFFHICDKIIRVKLLVERIIERVIKDSASRVLHIPEDYVLHSLGILVRKGELRHVVFLVGPFALRVGEGDFLILGIIPEKVDFIAPEQVFGKVCHGWRDDAGVALEGAGLLHRIVDFPAGDYRLLALEGRGYLLSAQTVENLLAAERVGEEQHRVGHSPGMVYLVFLHSPAHGHGIGEEAALGFIVVSVGRNIKGGDAVHGMGRGGRCIDGCGADGARLPVEVAGNHLRRGTLLACCMQVFPMAQLCKLGAVEQGEEEGIQECLAAHVHVNGGIIYAELLAPGIYVLVSRMFRDADLAGGSHGSSGCIGYEGTEVVDGDVARYRVVGLAEQFFSVARDGDGGILAAYLEREGVEGAGKYRRAGLMDNCNHIFASLNWCKDRMGRGNIKIPSHLTVTGYCVFNLLLI